MTPPAVILARGLGTRMRRADAGAPLDAEQQAAADSGLKAMIPVGRPFLDHVLAGLADAGVSSVCLVIGPEHGVVRERYGVAARPSRIAVDFAVQVRPLGTADAVLAAEQFAAGRPVLVLNADNLYPAAALRDLAALESASSGASAAGLLGFRRSALLADGNIPPERIRAFALISVGPGGYLDRIAEKPDDATLRSFGPDPLVSMNAWLLPPAIYDACRAIVPSPRGELELQDAVRYAIDHLGVRFRVVDAAGPVLDLSSRADIAAVTGRLAAVEVRL